MAKHADWFVSQGTKHFALGYGGLEQCSWCDNLCTWQMIENGTGYAEYCCNTHADKYFFHALTGFEKHETEIVCDNWDADHTCAYDKDRCDLIRTRVL